MKSIVAVVNFRGVNSIHPVAWAGRAPASHQGTRLPSINNEIKNGSKKCDCKSYYLNYNVHVIVALDYPASFHHKNTRRPAIVETRTVQVPGTWAAVPRGTSLLPRSSGASLHQGGGEHLMK